MLRHYESPLSHVIGLAEYFGKTDQDMRVCAICVYAWLHSLIQVDVRYKTLTSLQILASFTLTLGTSVSYASPVNVRMDVPLAEVFLHGGCPNMSKQFDYLILESRHQSLVIPWQVENMVSVCDPPFVQCRDTTVSLDASGFAALTPSLILLDTAVQCGLDTLYVSPDAAFCPDVGVQSVTLTVVDANGDSASCTAQVTIVDEIDPIAKCKDITAYLDPLGTATVPGSALDDGSTDACGIATFLISQSEFTCAEIGPNTTTLVVIDVNNNASICNGEITIVDTIAPVAQCTDATVYLDGSGQAALASPEVDNGSTDACGIADRSLDISSFNCQDVGSANGVVLTVTDNNGNFGQCTALVTVMDTVAPVAQCQDITVYLDSEGNTEIDAETVNAGTSDACGLAAISVAPAAFTCADTGPNSVTLTATDSSGNVHSCLSVVTVVDSFPPQAICKDITVLLDSTGNVGIVPADVDWESTDACGIASSSVQPEALSCADVGANPVELQLTDIHGNMSSCTASVLVQDSVRPVTICQDVTVQLDSLGIAGLDGEDVDGGSSDACGIALRDVSQSTFTCSEVGANTVTLSIIDNYGNENTCTSTVTVSDTVPPQAICGNLTIYLDSLGSVVIQPEDIDQGSSDACGINSRVIDISTFDCSSTGEQIVTLTLMDVNNNSESCTAAITVADTTPPLAECRDITVQLDATGNGTISGQDINDGSSDACGIGVLEAVPGAFSCADAGPNEVTLTVTDVNGNIGTCTSSVYVQDTIPPEALCRNVTLFLDSEGTAALSADQLDDGSSDDCGVVSLQINQSTFNCSQIGDNTVVLTVEDQSGNVATCSAFVTVADTISPVALCDDITVQLDPVTNSTSITAAQVDGGSYDMCEIFSLEVNPETFDCADAGIVEAILTVTDASGNGSTCVANVDVVDSVSPVAVCQDVTVSLDTGGVFQMNGVEMDGGSSDACGSISAFEASPSNFTCSDIGVNTAVLTVIDNNGNSDTCTAGVMVEDHVAPLASCKDITIALDSSGSVSLSPGLLDDGSYDACGIDTFSVDIDNFFCAAVGENVVVLTMTDVNNNVSSCSAVVTVQDTVPPSAQCKDITVELNNNGLADVTPQDVDNGSEDACGIVFLETDNGQIQCGDVGLTIVNLSVTDQSGNTSTCSAQVTVEDNVNPEAICQDITVYLDATGQRTIEASDLDGGSSDACGVASLIASKTKFTCSDAGISSVTLAVIDQHDNVSICVAQVTTIDSIKPVAQCKDYIVYLDGSGSSFLDGMSIDTNSADACGISSYLAEPDTFTCDDIGLNPVVLTVEDFNGNSSTCSSVVTVADTIAPQALCNDITVYLDANGTGAISAQDLDGGSNDACGIEVLSAGITDLTCIHAGQNVVTLVAIDSSGNSDSCSALVTVFDTIAPVAICQDVTTYLDDTGNAQISGAELDGGSEDGCGAVTLTVQPSAFTCAQTGQQTVTLTVQDSYGNESACFATVTVMDTVAPVAACQDITAYLNASGNVTASVELADSGSEDPCGISSRILSPSAFNCTHIGTNTSVLYVEDVNGNQSSCTLTVAVLDTVSPSAVCQDITVQLDENGSMAIDGSYVDGGSSDACGIAARSASPDTFGCDGIGENVVLLTVFDSSGNFSTCQSNVVVEDSVSPEVTCIDITVYLDETGFVSITPADLSDGSTDACGDVSTTIDKSEFYCEDVGLNTVTVAGTDQDGNQSVCFAGVTVIDTVPPQAMCKTDTAYLNNSGNVIITASSVDDGSTDACGVSSTNVVPFNFGCFDIGQNVVTLRVNDVNGNSSTCSSAVTVADTIAPLAECQDVTLHLNADGNADLDGQLVDAGSFDVCGIASRIADPSTFSCPDVGINSATLIVSDTSGNQGFCQFDVMVVDSVSPSVFCKDITVDLDNTGSITIDVAQVDNGTSDACGLSSLSLERTEFSCLDVGLNVISLLAVDSNGNQSICFTEITIEDSTAPSASCKDDTVYVTVNGNVSITTSNVDDGTFDACGLSSLNVAPTAFGCSDLGAHEVVLTATDENSNTSTCTAEVLVLDTLAPIAVCTEVTVQLDASGSATLNPEALDGGSSDVCGIASHAASRSTFDCTDVGSLVLTLTVTDSSGNAGTCTSSVFVADSVSPLAQCRDITVYLETSGTVTVTEAQVDSASSDACGLASLNLEQDEFSCSDVGSNTMTLTATDVNGNQSVCFTTVTVVDTIAPDAVCRDVTVYLGDGGNVILTAAAVDNGTSDACSLTSLQVAPSAFSCDDTGTSGVILTATDNSGNESFCTASVTVSDTLAPVATCNDLTLELDGDGTAQLDPSQIDGGSTDVCGVDILVTSQDNFTCADIGVNQITLTVTDSSDNASSCQANVTVSDSISPTALCRDVTVYLNAGGSISVTAAQIDNGSSDACGLNSLILEPSNFTCADVGTNTVTLTAADDSGNESICFSSITVLDTTAPVALCRDIPAYISSNGNVSITAAAIDDGSTDACGISTLNVFPSVFGCADIGIQEATLTVMDVFGNQNSCTALVNVSDTLPPTAQCTDLTVELDPSGQAILSPEAIDNASADVCGIATRSVAPQSFNCGDAGSQVVTLTVSDSSGNQGTCNANVQVEDNISPLAQCRDVTIQLDASGQVSIVPADVDNNTSDACEPLVFALDNTDFSCVDVGLNTVIMTVTDANGNQSNCSAHVTVEDTLAPVINCLDVTLYLDGAGQAFLPVDAVIDDVTDACGIDTLFASETTFSCGDVGMQEVTLTAIDSNDNTGTCSSFVQIGDTISPVAVCTDITVELDDNGSALLTPEDIDDGSSDACGIQTSSISKSTFTCADVGTHNIALTLTDASGNADTCTSAITILDTIKPAALCNNLTVYLDAAGSATITGEDIGGNTDDACGPVTLSLDNSTFTCPDAGTQTVTLYATDINGNQSSCLSEVTVQDTIAPAAACRDITVFLNASGNVLITAADIDDGSSDACGVESYLISQSSFGCLDIGVWEVVLTVTDVNSNQKSCQSTVTVSDTIAPVAACRDVTLYLDSGGSAFLDPADMDNGSFDVCGIQSRTVSQEVFACTDIGLNEISLTISDTSGNVGSCAAHVTVTDTVSPVVLCNDITVNLDTLGMAEISAAEVDNGSFDACGAVALVLDQTSFTCADTGGNTLGLTGTDVNGNQGHCLTNVTVVDVVTPLIACRDDTVYLSSSGNASITPSDVDDGSIDACGIESMTVAPSTFSCADIGGHNVVLTVTDNNGNISTCDATVQVADTTAPLAVCTDITLQLDVSGNVVLDPQDIDGGSTDICGIETLVASQTALTCADVGTQPVTLTITDSTGNASSCSAQVTVSDSVGPAVECIDVTVYLDEFGEVSLSAGDVSSGASDACGDVTLSLEQSFFTCTDAGFTTLSLIAVDGNGNESLCFTNVTVADTVAPSALCQDITVFLNEGGNAPVSAGAVDDNSSDACGVASLVVQPTSFGCAETGLQQVELTVTDSNFNVNSCIASVMVNDTVAPTAICADVIVHLDETGIATPDPSLFDAGSTDVCGIQSYELSQEVFSCGDIGLLEVTLTITDVNGNSDSCTAHASIVDEVPPAALCNDVTVYLDALGEVSVTASEVDNGSSDACGSPALLLEQTEFSCADVGENTISLSATDNSGNVSLCPSTITVRDTIAPGVVCQGTTVFLSESGNAFISAPEITGGSSDACGVASLSAFPSAFGCADIGVQSVTLTAVDVNGNEGTCLAEVSVVDTLPPVLTNCPADVTFDNDYLNCSYLYGFGPPSVNDNCDADPELAVSAYSNGFQVNVNNFGGDYFASFPVGVTNVYCVATDESGNVDTCTFSVTVLDVQAPVITNCPEAITKDAEEGQCGAAVNWSPPTASDNCTGVSLVSTHLPGDYFPVGTTTVTYTARDASGNETTCIFDVTVIDNQAPMIGNCPEDITVVNDPGECGAVVSWTALSIADNCGVANIDMTHASGGLFSTGNTQVTMTATDDAGNAATCSFNVTVVDNEQPTATCSDTSIQIGPDKMVVIDPAALGFTASDNCFVDTTYLSTDTLRCEDLGSQEITFTIVDGAGLMTQCKSVVTLIDTNVVCYWPSIYVYVDSSATDGENTGVSWQNAFLEVQDALATAQEYPNIEEIWVTGAIYYPTQGMDSTASFNLVAGTRMYAGFTGNESSLAQRNMAANPTILCGDIGTPDDSTDNVVHVVTIADTVQGAMLDGFIIALGNADGNTGMASMAGGILNQGELWLRNVEITGCTAVEHGAAILNTGPNAVLLLEDCVFKLNNSMSGEDIMNVNDAQLKFAAENTVQK